MCPGGEGETTQLIEGIRLVNNSSSKKLTGYKVHRTGCHLSCSAHIPGWLLYNLWEKNKYIIHMGKQWQRTLEFQICKCQCPSHPPSPNFISWAMTPLLVLKLYQFGNIYFWSWPWLAGHRACYCPSTSRGKSLVKPKGSRKGVVPELQYLPWDAPGMAQLFLAPFYGLCRDRL